MVWEGTQDNMKRLKLVRGLSNASGESPARLSPTHCRCARCADLRAAATHGDKAAVAFLPSQSVLLS